MQSCSFWVCSSWMCHIAFCALICRTCVDLVTNLYGMELSLCVYRIKLKQIYFSHQMRWPSKMEKYEIFYLCMNVCLYVQCTQHNMLIHIVNNCFVENGIFFIGHELAVNHLKRRNSFDTNSSNYRCFLRLPPFSGCGYAHSQNKIPLEWYRNKLLDTFNFW